MFEDVKPGDPIPLLASFWNNLKAMVRARRLLPGVGVRLREMPFGTNSWRLFREHGRDSLQHERVRHVWLFFDARLSTVDTLAQRG